MNSLEHKKTKKKRRKKKKREREKIKGEKHWLVVSKLQAVNKQTNKTVTAMSGYSDRKFQFQLLYYTQANPALIYTVIFTVSVQRLSVTERADCGRIISSFLF